MPDQETDISFVIPAFNEEDSLGGVLRSIQSNVPDGLAYEVIVVDHQSTDRTADVAREFGALTLTHPARTIGELRNFGADAASGSVLVFLDADVLLTPDWGVTLQSTLHGLDENPCLVTGSWPDIPPDGSWIERHWFNRPEDARPRHVGTGHLITTRRFFRSLGGFDESLETGEDYEFCRRARAESGRIEENSSLRVVHTGYPKTLGQFVRREIWHGRGDWGSLRMLVSSKVAMLTLGFFGLHGLGLFSAVRAVGWGQPSWLVTSALACLGIFLICFLSSIAKYRRRGPRKVLLNTVLFYFYFLARGLSLLRPGHPRKG